MKPLMQTKFGRDEGNCFSACIASILEMPVDQVPNFCVDYRSNWFEETDKWLAKLGLTLIRFEIADVVPDYDVYWIASGLSPRWTCDHSVIYRSGTMVHDPHPSGDGLKGKPKCGELIVFRSLPLSVIKDRMLENRFDK